MIVKVLVVLICFVVTTLFSVGGIAADGIDEDIAGEMLEVDGEEVREIIKGDQSKENVESSTSSSDPDRDPFFLPQRPGKLLKPFFGGDLQFKPSAGAPVPSMRLSGFISSEGINPVALLDVKGSGVYVVRKGDVISLFTGGKKNVIRIRKITNLTVSVEVGELGMVIIVR